MFEEECNAWSEIHHLRVRVIGRLSMRSAVLLIPFALSCFVAGAQPPDDRVHAGQSQLTRTKERNCPLLATRAPAEPAEQLGSCEQTLTLHSETPVSVTSTLDVPQKAYCAATYAIEYTQKNTKVGVEGVIENKGCAASSGEYKLLVRVRDETGEVKTLDFLGSWQRDDDQPVKFGGDYPIGNDVDLVNVRVTQVRCTCADATRGEESAPEP